MMKNAILIMSMFIILALLNVGIIQKEQILKGGDVILLKIKPVDPRSIMAGDYMAFNYKMSDDIEKKADIAKHGFLVIKTGSDNIAEFVRFYQGGNLAPDEKLLKYVYSRSTNAITIKPNSFHFQEGLQPLYQKAEYAILHYQGAKSYLLVGLADREGNEITNAN
jgi:uncharacterized membrane-anchored protein